MSDEHRGRAFLATLSDHCQNLPFSPVILQDLFKATDASSTTSLDDIGTIISRDQGLTARLLNLANSAFYGLQAQVTSVSRAAALLGLKEIRNLALITGVKAMTDKHLPPAAFSLTDYWRHNLEVAFIAQDLARECSLSDPQSLFAAGMLHDLGKLLTAIYAPDDWEAINEMVERENIACHLAENIYWALEHGVVGSMALSAWNLPRQLCEPVNWHHAPRLAKELNLEARILQLADMLAHHLARPDTEPDPKMIPLLSELGTEFPSLGSAESYVPRIAELLAREGIDDKALALA